MIRVQSLSDTGIVWERYAQFLGDDGAIHFEHIFLTEKDRTKLLSAFGQGWLDRYLENAEQDFNARNPQPD